MKICVATTPIRPYPTDFPPFGSMIIVQSLRELGHEVIATGEDFFKCNYGDICISNPPYSTFHTTWNRQNNIKTEIIQRLAKLNKPFMLLIPLAFLQTKQFKLFQEKYGTCQMIIPYERIKFYYYKDGKKLKYNTPNHHGVCFWLCWKINLKKDINYV